MTADAASGRGGASLEIDGRSVRISTPERPLWPDLKITKADLIGYYVRVAPALLPHLRDRPVVLARFPEGITGKGFFQIRCPPHPEWVRTQPMYVFTPGKDVEVVVVDDLASLVWAANLSTIEFHPYLGRGGHLDRPDFVVFDLDPGPPADLVDVCRVALRLRDVLGASGLVAFPKTSGAKGLHLYVPVSGDYTYADTKTFARAVAALVAREDPERVTDKITKSLRPGRVFIDWGQNDVSKSMAAAYSLRARSVPLVSTPVAWEEVEAVTIHGTAEALRFGPAEALERIAGNGDLFRDTLSLRQTLPVVRRS